MMNLIAAVLQFLVVLPVFEQGSGHPDQPSLSRAEVLERFLSEFDQIRARGFIRTLRSGDTGIGYTLESLLNIPENNSPRGDYFGMEVKAYRDSEQTADNNEKMNLFLKEPEWVDGLTSEDRVKLYGYADGRQRPALYQSVTCEQGKRGFQLRVSAEKDRLDLCLYGRPIGRWNRDILQERLTEKHGHTVFVAADCRGTGSGEEFWFRTVTWCQDPSTEKFFGLITSGDIIVELRMHVEARGSVRNHGTAFRIRKSKLPELFASRQSVRPTNAR